MGADRSWSGNGRGGPGSRAARGLAIGALALGMAASSNLAKAVDAEGIGPRYVGQKHSEIGEPLRSANFARASNPAPQWTPDWGVFWYFTGYNGEGAIYWREGTRAAYMLHGAILAEFKRTNFEIGNGYPTTDEYAAPANSLCNDPARGYVATRQQEFDDGGHFICFSPSRGTWHRYRPIWQ